MNTHIQVRNVPEAVHRTLKARAALAGTSLSDYLRVELERLAKVPSMEEFQHMLAGQPRTALPGGAAKWLYEAREEREVSYVNEAPSPAYGSKT